jgi:hypothetical protein
MGKKARAKRQAPSSTAEPAVESRPSATWVLGLWIVAAALTVWSFGYRVVSGGDLWWHLAAGRWIVEHRTLPASDPWSFTAGRPWANHEWLADVVYHGWAGLFGTPSLAVWKWAVLGATFLLVGWVLWRLTRNAPASYLAVLVAAGMASPFLDIRPHLYTLLCYAALLALTLLPEQPSRALPLLFLVWANLHGGVFFGWMALAVILGVHFLLSWRTAPPGGIPWLRPAGLWLACVLASFLNPHGWEVLTLPLKYAFSAESPYRELLREWQPPFGGTVPPPPFFALGMVLVGAAVFYLFASPRSRPDRPIFFASLALAALTLAMSLKSQRFIPLFAISENLLVGSALSAMLSPLLRVRFAEAALALLALAFAGVRLAPYPLSPAAFHALTDEDSFPVETCNFLRANQLPVKVFAFYRWGGYLHLCAGDAVKVYIDGRADTVFEEEAYERYVQVLRREPGWMGVLESSGADAVLWPRDQQALIDDLLRSGRWREIHRDFVAVLLVREDVALPRPAKATPESAWRDLALGGEAMRENRLAEAEAHLTRALERMPALAAACENLAILQAHRGETESARQTGERCQEIFPDPNLAKDLARMGIGR